MAVVVPDMEHPPSNFFLQGFPLIFFYFLDLVRGATRLKITYVRVEVSKQVVVGEVAGAAHRAEQC